jgi:hypothetical protein
LVLCFISKSIFLGGYFYQLNDLGQNWSEKNLKAN